jgi:hypothetical protein
MHERDLKTREPSCVTRVAKPLFIYVVHSPSGAVGRGSTGSPLAGRQSPGPWDTWQHRNSPLRKAEPGAIGHMAALELTSARG